MGKKIEISQATLLGFMLTLMISLMGLAYLLGRQSVAAPSAVLTQTAPPPMTVALSEARPEGGIPSERLKAQQPPVRPVAIRTSAKPLVKVRTDNPSPVRSQPQRAVPSARPIAAPIARAAEAKPEPARVPPAVPAPSAAPARTPVPTVKASAAKSSDVDNKDSAAISEYLSQIDSAMLGTQALGDPSQFATQLLSQSLQGDTSGFDSLIASATATRDQVRAIRAPKSCKEHHTMLVRQLDQSLSLLGKVHRATTSLDTASLTALSSQGRELQAEAARFQKLDHSLRENS